MKRKMTAIALAALLLAACLSGCAQNAADANAAQTQAAADTQAAQPAAAETSGTVAQGSAANVENLSADISNSDANTAWGESDTKITLSGTSITVAGQGAQVSDNVVTITAKGTYVVSGTLVDGQVVIAATSSDKVHLVLNGANITNKTGVAIYASQCDKLIVTLAEGAQNSLTDGGAAYVYADTENEEPNAALFCKDDLTINGTGSLTVTAGFNNGVGTKDDLLVVSGDIAITAANHGMRGNDSVTVLGGNIHITAGKDGLQTNNTEDASKGWILIEGGRFVIESADDAIHADGDLTITGAATNINIITSYEGLEARTMTIAGGTIVLYATDDGINIAGGNDTSGTGQFGRDTFSAAGSERWLRISGGSITVTAGRDGIDINGSGEMTGGDVSITAATLGEGNTIDSDRGFTRAGGNLTESGGNAMGGGMGGRGGPR